MELPIRSFTDLVKQQDLDYGTVPDTSIFDYIMVRSRVVICGLGVEGEVAPQNCVNTRFVQFLLGIEISWRLISLLSLTEMHFLFKAW